MQEMPFNFVAFGKEHAEWFRAQQVAVLTEDTKGIVALKNGEPVAAVILNKWSPTSCEGHMVIKNSFVIKYGFLDEVYNYVFNTCGREKMYAWTHSVNWKIRKLLTHLGWKDVFTLKDRIAKGVDGILMEYSKDDWAQLRRAA